MDILGALPNMTNENQFVELMTFLYSTLTSEVPTSKTTAKHITSIFYEMWIVPFSIPDYLLTDNGTQFMSRFFETICCFFWLKYLSSRA